MICILDTLSGTIQIDWRIRRQVRSARRTAVDHSATADLGKPWQVLSIASYLDIVSGIASSDWLSLLCQDGLVSCAKFMSYACLIAPRVWTECGDTVKEVFAYLSRTPRHRTKRSELSLCDSTWLAYGTRLHEKEGKRDFTFCLWSNHDLLELPYVIRYHCRHAHRISCAM